MVDYVSEVLYLKTARTISTVIHIADLHIRDGCSKASSRSDEYGFVFDGFLDDISQLEGVQEKSALLVICGDVFHHRLCLDSGGTYLLHRFMRRVMCMVDVLVIAGNHDYAQEQTSDTDCIEANFAPYFDESPWPHSLHYLRRSGTYLCNNVAFGLISIKDTLDSTRRSGMIREALPPFPDSREVFPQARVHVALFHGMVDRRALALKGEKGGGLLGMEKPRDRLYPLTWFAGYDAVMLGDVHKQQLGTLDGRATWAYPGSLLQQTRGEHVDAHGYVLWDLASTPPHAKLIRVLNDHVIAAVSVSDGGAASGFEVRVSKSPVVFQDARDFVRDRPHLRYIRALLRGGDEQSPKKLRRVLLEAGAIDVSLEHAPSIVGTGNACMDVHSDDQDEDRGAEGGRSLGVLEDVGMFHLDALDMLTRYMRQNAPGTTDLEKYVLRPSEMLLPEAPDVDGCKEPGHEVLDRIRSCNEPVRVALRAYDDAVHSDRLRIDGRHPVRFRRLHWDFLFAYGENNYIDFTSVDGKVVILNGANASGKSSVCDILCLALYGELTPMRGDIDGRKVLTHNDRPQGHKCPPRAWLEFEICREDETTRAFRAYHAYDADQHDRSRNLSACYVHEITDSRTVVLATGKKSVERWVVENVGTLENLLMANIVCQKDMDGFLGKKQATQREIWKKAFGLCAVTKFGEATHEAIKAARAVRDTVKNILLVLKSTAPSTQISSATSRTTARTALLATAAAAAATSSSTDDLTTIQERLSRTSSEVSHLRRREEAADDNKKQATMKLDRARALGLIHDGPIDDDPVRLDDPQRDWWTEMNSMTAMDLLPSRHEEEDDESEVSAEFACLSDGDLEQLARSVSPAPHLSRTYVEEILRQRLKNPDAFDADTRRRLLEKLELLETPDLCASRVDTLGETGLEDLADALRARGLAREALQEVLAEGSIYAHGTRLDRDWDWDTWRACMFPGVDVPSQGHLEADVSAALAKIRDLEGRLSSLSLMRGALSEARSCADSSAYDNDELPLRALLEHTRVVLREYPTRYSDGESQRQTTESEQHGDGDLSAIDTLLKRMDALWTHAQLLRQKRDGILEELGEIDAQGHNDACPVCRNRASRHRRLALDDVLRTTEDAMQLDETESLELSHLQKRVRVAVARETQEREAEIRETRAVYEKAVCVAADTRAWRVAGMENALKEAEMAAGQLHRSALKEVQYRLTELQEVWTCIEQKNHHDRADAHRSAVSTLERRRRERRRKGVYDLVLGIQRHGLPRWRREEAEAEGERRELQESARLKQDEAAVLVSELERMERMSSMSDKIERIQLRVLRQLDELEQLESLLGTQASKTGASAKSKGALLGDAAVANSPFEEYVFRGYIVGFVQDTMNRFLGCCGDDTLRVMVRYEGGMKLRMLHGGHELSMAFASGYQRFVLDIAMRAALAQTCGLGVNIRHIFIDEGFGTMDAENLQRASRVVDSLMRVGGFESVFLISHLKSIQALAHARIDVERSENGRSSRVRWPIEMLQT